jgi:hypothetical protein
VLLWSVCWSPKAAVVGSNLPPLLKMLDPQASEAGPLRFMAAFATAMGWRSGLLSPKAPRKARNVGALRKLVPGSNPALSASQSARIRSLPM